MDLSQTEGDDEICPSNAHSTLSAKLSSAEEDVHSLLNLPLEDAAEAGKFKLSVLARALRAAAAEGSLFDEVSLRELPCFLFLIMFFFDPRLRPDCR